MSTLRKRVLTVDKAIEEIVVIPSCKKFDESNNNNNNVVSKEFDSPPLRRTRSDGELGQRISHYTNPTTAFRTNWTTLADNLIRKRKQRQESPDSISFTSKRKMKQFKSTRLKIISSYLYGPIFYRSRFLSLVFLKTFLPIILVLLICYNFTGDVTWKKAHSKRTFNPSIKHLIAAFLCLGLCSSYVVLSYLIVHQMVTESKSGIKDFLTIHHMPKYEHWIIYFLHCLILQTITAIGITASLYIDFGHGSILSNSNCIIVYLLFFLHLMYLSSFNFFIGNLSFFGPKCSGLFSMAICFSSFVIPYCLERAELLSENHNLVLSLILPNWTLWNGIQEIVDYDCDSIYIGINWLNFAILNDNRRQLSCFQCILVCFVGQVGYFLMAMCWDLSKESKYSSKRSFLLYIIEKSILFRRMHQFLIQVTSKRCKVIPVSSLREYIISPGPILYERPDASECKCAIKIRNLNGKYGKNRFAFDDINFDIVHGEITVIYGYTHSGKSKLLQYIAGIIQPPPTGSVKYGKVDVFNNRNSLCIGYCPANPVLFNLLTLQQHIILCYQLRGLSNKDALKYTEKIMEFFNFSPKVRKLTPSDLTRNEKKKLAIGMSLVGEPSTVILDEPTRGMDQLARRETWNIIKKLKSEGRTIVISTNRMDETAFLADRIVFLLKGKLICFGTPQFLKEEFYTGDYLRITPNPVKFSLENFQSLPRKHFGTPLKPAPFKTMADHRNFLLVMPRDQYKYFPEFFKELKEMKDNLGVVLYETQNVSLSEVFMNISKTIPKDNVRKNQLPKKKNPSSDRSKKLKIPIQTQLPND